MPRFNFSVAPLVAAIAISIPAAARAQSLKVGDPAPALTVSKWVKGAPIKSLSDGKVHVVEFWATWCGPCLQTIPHLTELAAKYKGKADFTGVSVWEADQAKVVPFVKNMGDKMNYNVAMDTVAPGAKGDEGIMAQGWMTASGSNGIPTAFVVDKTGKIAWIGHPMGGLDEVVSKVAAGTFDAKAEADKKAAQQAQMMALGAKAQSVLTLVKAGKNDDAMMEYAALKAENPAFAFDFAMGGLYPALLKNNETAAFAFARSLGENEGKDNPMALNELAWRIIDPAGSVKTPDVGLAVTLAEKAVALTKEKDPMILDTLAVAHYKNGSAAKAVAAEEKAVALLNADPKADAATKKEITDRLAQYKKG